MNAVLAVVVPEELLAVVPEELLAMLAAVPVDSVAAPDTAVTAVHASQPVGRLVLAVQGARLAEAVWNTVLKPPMVSLAAAVQTALVAPLTLVAVSL